jgi:hypothetical protein
MRLLTTMRFKLHRAPGLVAVIFAIGWLGLAVAPCQAMPDMQHSGTSQHCPSPVDGCGHCPAAPSGVDTGCAAAASPGCQPDALAPCERRDIEFPQPLAGPPLAFPVFDELVPAGGLSWDFHDRRSPVSRVSIQQRYCTYLK